MKKLLLLMTALLVFVACEKDQTENSVKKAKSLQFKIFNVTDAPKAADVPKITLTTINPDGSSTKYLNFVWNGSEVNIDLLADKHPTLHPIENALAQFKSQYTVKISNPTVKCAVIPHLIGYDNKGNEVGRFTLVGANDEDAIVVYMSDDVVVKLSNKDDATKLVGDLKLAKGWNFIKIAPASASVIDPATITAWQFVKFK